MKDFARFALVCAVLLLPSHLFADSITINFDSLADFESVTTQFAGLTFSNATVLTAGISLNEFELPPFSGSNVVFDDGGPLSIAFTASMVAFSGYFTYLEPVTIQAYDAANNIVGSSSSAFTSNLELSGDAGSFSNELLSLSFASGFSRITITGNIFGGSFTLDDLTYTPGSVPPPTPAPVPEPFSVVLLGTGLVLLFVRRRGGN